jgi:hypothetical protein
MTNDLETTVAPSAIERTMSICEIFKDRDHAKLVQARKALTEHIFARSRTEAGGCRTGASEVAGDDGGSAEAMKIKSHSESHIVELDDGSRWQIFPGTSTSYSTGNPRPSSDRSIR